MDHVLLGRGLWGLAFEEGWRSVVVTGDPPQFMIDKLNVTFGHIIAYLAPGFLALYALADFIPDLRALIGDGGSPEAEALIPLLLLALAVGIVIDAVSWAVIRPAIGLTGVKRPPSLTYAALTKDDLEVYNTIIEANFRYHQFYANMLVAVMLHAGRGVALPVHEHLLRNGSFFFVTGILFIAARDALGRAYARMLSLLRKETATMTNGDPVDPGKPVKTPSPAHRPPSKLRPATPSQPGERVQRGPQEAAQEERKEPGR